ncbi:MAG: hypothetical protein JXR77_18075, partial [Lentisphaeria bacterium]|nr:hypothetical protein [Lentisphaeria bacterium]
MSTERHSQGGTAGGRRPALPPRRPPWAALLPVALLWTCMAPGVLGQISGHAEVSNPWITPAPAVGNPWYDHLPTSTACHSGHVHDALTVGEWRLRWSRIGQAVEGPSKAGTHFDLGEEISASPLVPAGADLF